MIRKAAVVLSAAMTLGATDAAILALEDFGTGSTGLPPLDGSTGTGWAAGWTNASGTGQRSNITGMSRTNGYNPSLGDTGFLHVNERTGRNLNTTLAGPFASYLDTNGNIGADGTTIYVAALMGMNTTNVAANYYGMEIHRDGTGDANRIIQVAAEAGSPANRSMDFRAYNAVSGAENLFLQTGGVGDYLIIRFDFGVADADTVTLYRNPLFNALESASTPLASISGTNFSFDRISFASFGGSNLFLDFDDLRVGEVWADVAGVPEPTIFGLIGLSSLLLWVRKRR